MKDALFSYNSGAAARAAIKAALSFGFTVRNYGKGWVIDTADSGCAGERLPVNDIDVNALCHAGAIRYQEQPEYLEVVM